MTPSLSIIQLKLALAPPKGLNPQILFLLFHSQFREKLKSMKSLIECGFALAFYFLCDITNTHYAYQQEDSYGCTESTQTTHILRIFIYLAIWANTPNYWGYSFIRQEEPLHQYNLHRLHLPCHLPHSLRPFHLQAEIYLRL